MNKLSLSNKLTPLGMAILGAAGSMAIAPTEAQAAILFEGTIGDWAQAGTILAGDKFFTITATNLNSSNTLIIETAGVNDLDYLLSVGLSGADTIVTSFFLDYSVGVAGLGFLITAVDLDSTVDVFPPAEVLKATYNPIIGPPVTLTSTSGSPDFSPITPTESMVVSNVYSTDIGGEISAFENSFQQSAPEPLTLLGAGAAVAFGAAFKRRKS